ncbi:MAG: hypothetical protein GX336_01125 [Halanaerobiaceae bacterium]|nr:hypothetical protein [Halanaerobiaceae bacterium]
MITDKEYNTAEEFAEIMGTALKEAIKKIENENRVNQVAIFQLHIDKRDG